MLNLLEKCERLGMSATQFCSVTSVWCLGTLGYKPAYRLQELLAARHLKKKNSPCDQIEKNTLLIVEHPPGTTVSVSQNVVSL